MAGGKSPYPPHGSAFPVPGPSIASLERNCWVRVQLFAYLWHGRLACAGCTRDAFTEGFLSWDGFFPGWVPPPPSTSAPTGLGLEPGGVHPGPPARVRVLGHPGKRGYSVQIPMVPNFFARNSPKFLSPWHSSPSGRHFPCRPGVPQAVTPILPAPGAPHSPGGPDPSWLCCIRGCCPSWGGEKLGISPSPASLARGCSQDNPP